MHALTDTCAQTLLRTQKRENSTYTSTLLCVLPKIPQAGRTHRPHAHPLLLLVHNHAPAHAIGTTLDSNLTLPSLSLFPTCVYDSA